MPVKELAEKLQITAPTIYSRIKNMLGSGVFKIAGQVDLFKLGHYQTAIVAINVNVNVNVNVNDDSKFRSPYLAT